MTNEQIIAGNKLIAKFMGGITAEENHKIVYRYRDIWLPIHGLCTWTTIKSGMGKILRYHDSWDWLMPVVEFIERFDFSDDNDFNITIGSSGYCKISDCLGSIEFIEDGRSKINCVYMCVLRFINWYNENKK